MSTQLSPARRAWPVLAAVLLLTTACVGQTPAPPTPSPSGTAATSAVAPPTSTSATAVWMQVAEGQGANLRAEPNVTATRLKTLRAGTLVLVVGPDREADGQAWRNVRDAEGINGWVAAELLAQPGTAPPAAVAETAVPIPPDGSREERPRTGVPSAPAAEAVSGQQTVRFLVRTITCPGCQARVASNAKKVPGVLNVDVEGQDVTVTYDPSQTTPDVIAAGIEKAGDRVVRQ